MSHSSQYIETKSNSREDKGLLVETESLPKIPVKEGVELKSCGLDENNLLEVKLKDVIKPVAFESLNRKVNSILEALCISCSTGMVSYSESTNLCLICKSIFCDNCAEKCQCIKCKKEVCDKHSIKCFLCAKRSCKAKSCINEFRICQMCEYTFCQNHFDTHKKFNLEEKYGIKCLTKKCKQKKIELDNVEAFAMSIMNASLIKELRLR
jgi:hypothetical protein